MKQYLISEEAVKGIIAYLAKRPYEEVAQGIQVLSNLQEYLEPVETKAKK